MTRRVSASLVALMGMLVVLAANAGLLTVDRGGRGAAPPAGGDFAAPSFLTSMTVNTWATINTAGETLRDEEPCPGGGCAYTGGNGVSCILDDCWAGAVVAPGYGTKGGYIAWGGGHAGYFGSEVYAFDFGTQAWARLTDPQPDGSPGAGGGGFADGIYSNGAPIAPHTYYNLFYHAPSNSLASLHIEVNALGSNEITKPVRFDLDTLTWSAASSTGSTNAYAGWTVYDEARNLVITEGGDTGAQFVEYAADDATLLTGTYTARTAKFTALEGAAAIDTANDVLFLIDAPYLCPRDDPYVLSMTNRAAAPTAMTTAGTLPSLCEGSLVYVPGLSAFLFRPSGAGATVYTVALTSGTPLTGTWTWTNVLSGSNAVTPTVPGSDTGRYNKFQCIEYDDAIGCYEVNSVDGNVYAYRAE